MGIMRGGMVVEYLKAEYRRLVKLFCEKYNQIIGQDIFSIANNRTSEKEEKEREKEMDYEE